LFAKIAMAIWFVNMQRSAFTNGLNLHPAIDRCLALVRIISKLWMIEQDRHAPKDMKVISKQTST